MCIWNPTRGATGPEAWSSLGAALGPGSLVGGLPGQPTAPRLPQLLPSLNNFPDASPTNCCSPLLLTWQALQHPYFAVGVPRALPASGGSPLTGERPSSHSHTTSSTTQVCVVRKPRDNHVRLFEGRLCLASNAPGQSDCSVWPQSATCQPLDLQHPGSAVMTSGQHRMYHHYSACVRLGLLTYCAPMCLSGGGPQRHAWRCGWAPWPVGAVTWL